MNIHCNYTELKNPDQLVEHPKNPNKHEDRQIDALAKIIKHQGWRNPIVVSSRSGYVVAGHGRLMAAKKLGAECVPVDIQEFQDEATEYAHMIADNKIAEFAQMDDQTILELLSEIGEDFDLELAGLLDGFDFEVENIDADPDDFDGEPPEEPTTKLGQVFKLGKHRLMCGDSTIISDVKHFLKGKIIDMLYTDPPYGISIVKQRKVGGDNIIECNKYAPVMGDDDTEVAEKFIGLISELEIKTKVIWGGNYYAKSLENSPCWIVWDKDNTGDFADAELAWTNQKTAVRIFKHTWNGLIKASERNQKRVHPTQKPVALAKWCFKNYNDPKTVFDAFGGSGSTLIACEETNKACYMMELSPAYCDVIIKRWEDYTGKKAELIE